MRWTGIDEQVEGGGDGRDREIEGNDCEDGGRCGSRHYSMLSAVTDTIPLAPVG